MKPLSGRYWICDMSDPKATAAASIDLWYYAIHTQEDTVIIFLGSGPSSDPPNQKDTVLNPQSLYADPVHFHLACHVQISIAIGASPARYGRSA